MASTDASTDASANGSLKERVARQGEEALGKLAQDLLQNPVVHGTISTVFETRERAARVQEVAMGALNLPSANDLARLTRRLRSVSQRIEGLEDGLDRIIDRLDQMRPTDDFTARLEAIEEALQRLERSLPADSSSAPGDGEVSEPDTADDPDAADPSVKSRKAGSKKKD